MKKVILGSIMFFTGILSIAIILAGSMSNELTVDGNYSAMRNIQQYGLMPSVYIFGVIAFIGLTLAVWGLFEKKN